jgi:hypothetical protein
MSWLGHPGGRCGIAAYTMIGRLCANLTATQPALHLPLPHAFGDINGPLRRQIFSPLVGNITDGGDLKIMIGRSAEA